MCVLPCAVVEVSTATGAGLLGRVGPDSQHRHSVTHTHIILLHTRRGGLQLGPLNPTWHLYSLTPWGGAAWRWVGGIAVVVQVRLTHTCIGVKGGGGGGGGGGVHMVQMNATLMVSLIIHAAHT